VAVVDFGGQTLHPEVAAAAAEVVADDLAMRAVHQQSSALLHHRTQLLQGVRLSVNTELTLAFRQLDSQHSRLHETESYGQRQQSKTEEPQ
jgi:hypothetical protein